MLNALVFVCFRWPRLGQKIKTSLITIQTVDPDMCSIFMFFKKGLGLPSQTHFVYDLGQNVNIARSKRALKLKWKAFFIILKVLSLKQIKTFSLRVGL